MFMPRDLAYFPITELSTELESRCLSSRIRFSSLTISPLFCVHPFRKNREGHNKIFPRCSRHSFNTFHITIEEFFQFLHFLLYRHIVQAIAHLIHVLQSLQQYSQLQYLCHHHTLKALGGMMGKMSVFLLVMH